MRVKLFWTGFLGGCAGSGALAYGEPQLPAWLNFAGGSAIGLLAAVTVWCYLRCKAADKAEDL
jgi:hypothetical protein